MELSSILENIGAAVVGGGASLAASLRSAGKKYRALKDSVEELSVEISKIKKDVVLNSAIKEWKEETVRDLRQKLAHIMDEAKEDLIVKVEGLRRGFRLELNDHKDDVERKFRDFERPTKPEFTTLDEFKRRLEFLEGRLERLRDEHGSFVKSQVFSDFTEEQARQWNEMNRRLGEILGALRRPPTNR